MLDQPAEALGADLGGGVAGQGRQWRGVGLVKNGIGDAGAEVRTARDLDLMFQTGLHEHSQQILILEDRAAREDGTGNLDVVERQDIDEGGGRPGRRREAFGQGLADIVLGLTGQNQKDVGQDRRQLLTGGGVLVAQGHHAHQKALPIFQRATAGEGEQVGHTGIRRLERVGVFQGDCRHGRQLPASRADDRSETMPTQLSIMAVKTELTTPCRAWPCGGTA